MHVGFLVIFCFSLCGCSKAQVDDVETDVIVEGSRFYYLILEGRNGYIDELYTCPEKYYDEYRCYIQGSFSWVTPVKTGTILGHIGYRKRPKKKICPYLRTSPRQDGFISLKGYCLNYCYLCFCIIKRDTVAVVHEGDLEFVHKDKGCDGDDDDDDEIGFDGDDYEDVNRGDDDETTTQKPASVDDAFLPETTNPQPEKRPPRPEPTTPRPNPEDIDEPEFFDEPGKGRKQPKENEKLIAEQSRNFTLDLLKAMRDEYEGENLVASPSALLAILKVFLSGAGGYTRINLQEVIGEPKEIQRIMIKPERGLSLKMRTALMYAANYELRENKERDLNARGVDTIPIRPDRPIQAARNINKWLSSDQNKHSNIFQPGDIESTELVVLNTLSFSGKFETPFVTESIEEFLTADGSAYNISMMSSEDGEAYETTHSRTLEANIVDLPYKNSKLKMRLIIPDDGVTLKQVEDKLSAKELRDIDETMQKRNITLKIPKVLYEAKKPIEGPLKRMGLNGLFRGANLERLFHPLPFDYIYGPSVYSMRVENIFQSVGINITEEGTVVSSHAVAVSNLLRNDEIVANKPFVLFIEDSISHQVLFFGRISH